MRSRGAGDSLAAGNTVTLRPGVAFCFRKFHPLISDLVRGAWSRLVRQQNLEVLVPLRAGPSV
jgi:hypothetical protein